MLIFENLTPAQTRIIKEICYTQLSSLRRIYNNEHGGGEDLVMLLIQNEVSPDDFKNQLELSMERVKMLSKKPDNLGNMNHTELSVFKHILFNIEDMFKEQYPKAVSNLWSRLFLIEDFKNVSLTSMN